jgi:TRAP-type C4-dicarboxylate transport system permease small subunit
MIQLAALRTTHIHITFFAAKLPPVLRHSVRLIIALICSALLAVMTWGATRMAAFVRHDFYVSIPWLSEKYEYLPLYGVGPLWALIILINEYRSLRYGTTG